MRFFCVDVPDVGFVLSYSFHFDEGELVILYWRHFAQFAFPLINWDAHDEKLYERIQAYNPDTDSRHIHYFDKKNTRLSSER